MTILKGAIRAEKRKRVLGTGARCERCGWDAREALVRTEDRLRCYECQLRKQGKRPAEEHHHLGRAVGQDTVTIPGNVHRDLSERQRNWPAEVRTNPQRDPLLWLAAAVMGLHDHLAWWVDWLERIAAWLVQLAERLAERDGERWWETMQLQPLWADWRAS